MFRIPARRATRLQRITEILYRSPKLYSSLELAEMLHVDQRTVQRDLAVLESEMSVPLVSDGKGGYTVDRHTRLAPLGLTVDEARALYLAIRLYLRNTDECDPDALTALDKLANALPSPMSDRFREAVETLSRRNVGAEYSEMLRVLTQGWARGRRVAFSYRSAKGHSSEIDLEPYFIEAMSRSTYVIGFSRGHKSVRVFKIERAHEPRLLPYSFEMPEDFEVESLLGSAWGVWIGGEKKDVILRFTPAIADLLLETRWHPSQVVEKQGDGSYLIKMTVSDTIEIAAWIRGWGPEVEVLAPAELREQFAREAAAVVELYREA